ADKYEHGLGVVQDDQQAVDWYRKSAALNNHVAQYSLGMMYMRGRGVPKDMVQARAWLIQSAEQGYDKARSALQEIAILPEG
ncbi:MAG: tetratricopeptide repeat protein, partial [Polaromonas sp.]|nr:tetratricopeptide repeat protein [Polaromonas sp.]